MFFFNFSSSFKIVLKLPVTFQKHLDLKGNEDVTARPFHINSLDVETGVINLLRWNAFEHYSRWAWKHQFKETERV